MIEPRSALCLSLALLLTACITTTYQVGFETTPGEWPATRLDIEHCLSSLGFRNASSEGFYPEILEEDPRNLAVWKPDQDISLLYNPPFSVAWVLEEDGAYRVHFVPHNARGEEAKFFALTFSECIQLHDPDESTSITTQRIVPDLR